MSRSPKVVATVKSANLWAAILAFGMLLAAASCTYRDSTEDPTQAATTANPRPKVLRLGTQDDANVPTRGQIEEFARQVQERSDATDQQIAAFRDASAPVYGVLEQDADTRNLIGRLRELAASTPVEPAVEPCDFDTY